MRTFDFTPLYRSAIGFDRLASLLDGAQQNDVPAYPPYNVELTGEDKYRITMALAGFDRSELEIEVAQGALRVSGRRGREEAPRTYLHRGIAARDFEHRFQLAEHVRVQSASFENGLLNIDLVREVPEAMKPRRVEIGGQPNVEVLERRAA